MSTVLSWQVFNPSLLGRRRYLSGLDFATTPCPSSFPPGNRLITSTAFSSLSSTIFSFPESFHERNCQCPFQVDREFIYGVPRCIGHSARKDGRIYILVGILLFKNKAEMINNPMSFLLSSRQSTHNLNRLLKPKLHNLLYLSFVFEEED
jgi:hypothetical protein